MNFFICDVKLKQQQMLSAQFLLFFYTLVKALETFSPFWCQKGFHYGKIYFDFIYKNLTGCEQTPRVKIINYFISPPRAAMTF